MGIGLLKQTRDMALNSRNGDAERGGHFRHAADLNDGQKNAQFSWCKFETASDRLQWRGGIQPGLVANSTAEARVRRSSAPSRT